MKPFLPLAFAVPVLLGVSFGQTLSDYAYNALAVLDSGNPFIASVPLPPLPYQGLRASTVPTLGALYPLSQSFFIDAATMNVGVGTVTPAASLDVNGTVRALGLRLPTGAGSGLVLTSDSSGTASWQSVPGGGVSGGGSAGYIPVFVGPGQLGNSLLTEGSSFVQLSGAFIASGEIHSDLDIEAGDDIEVDDDIYLTGDTANQRIYFQEGNQVVIQKDGSAGRLRIQTPSGGAADLTVVGNLVKGSGSFRIDHPLDPLNKYLSHSFVESPDMKNVYDGLVTLDESGATWVQLPNYFEALNRDFRYQLTCLGGYAPVYVANEVHGARFQIAGGTSGLRVSWQVTGIRKDPYADAHRIRVEEEKPADERGTCLHAEALPNVKADDR